MTVDETTQFLKALGARIKELRKAKNIRLRDIMMSTGYYDAQWRKYEAGGGLTVQSLLKVAIALDVSLSTLLADLGNWPLQSVMEIEKGVKIDGVVPRRRSTDLVAPPAEPASDKHPTPARKKKPPTSEA